VCGLNLQLRSLLYRNDASRIGAATIVVMCSPEHIMTVAMKRDRCATATDCLMRIKARMNPNLSMRSEPSSRWSQRTFFARCGEESGLAPGEIRVVIRAVIRIKSFVAVAH
jgi:hypothetical protein